MELEELLVEALAEKTAHRQAQMRASSERWRKRNPDVAKQRVAASVTKKAEHYKAYRKQWAKENSKALVAKHLARKKANPAKNAAERRTYVATKKRAMPAWADKAHIQTIYEMARELSLHLGIEFHVDHVIPLTSKVVCGLHVEHNLKIIPAEENQRKSNHLV